MAGERNPCDKREMDDVNDIDELRSQLAEAKAALGEVREIEERQSFLLRLNDALRPLADSAEIESTASRLLGRTPRRKQGNLS